MKLFIPQLFLSQVHTAPKIDLLFFLTFIYGVVI